MNFFKNFVLLICILSLPSCSFKDDIDKIENPIPKETNDVLDIYHRFLLGKLPIISRNGEEVYINDFNYFSPESSGGKFALFDVNHDDTVDLVIPPPLAREFLVLTAKDNLVFAYEGTQYDKLLNNGAILYEREAAGTSYYQYIETPLDDNSVIIDMEAIDRNHDGMPDAFYIDGQQVDDAEWDAYKGYIEYPSNYIIWNDYFVYIMMKTGDA